MISSRMLLLAAAVSMVANLATTAVAMGDCKKKTLDFVYLAGDASQTGIVNEIVADLAKVGITATAKPLVKDDKNAAMVAGKFNMVFSETWGNPYDPHSYLASWKAPDEAHHMVLETMKGGVLDATKFGTRIDGILGEPDALKRQAAYKSLLNDIHTAYIHIPLYGKRIPSVVSTRLMGYTPGHQQFDYPIKNIKASTGSSTMTISPGSQTGLFKSVGRLDPHSYRPNEFFASNWVYESLLQYGANGAIEPALATSWTISVAANKVETITFTLRENVKFHDGAAWNCTVAKLNFDHVLSNGLKGPDWHGWYSLPTAIKETRCDAGGKFIIEAANPYYPLLQELTYIRPLRMLSPNAFKNGLATSPVSDNSCPTGWGTVSCYKGAPTTCVSINCTGTTGIFGTGPFKFLSRTLNVAGDADDRVSFKRNADYWGGSPQIDVDIVRYDTAAAVEAALKAGTLDAAIGGGVLTPAAIKGMQFDSRFEVQHTEAIMNSVVILNIDDLEVRKTVVHAVNKGKIIDDKLGGLAAPVSQLFQTSAPFCDLDLVPKFGYDIQKAELINCPKQVDTASAKDVAKAKADAAEAIKKADMKAADDSALYAGLFIAAGCLAILLIFFVVYMMQREKSGSPLFTPLVMPEGQGKSNKIEMA